MNNNKHYYEIDRSFIEISMRRARRERNLAVWALLSRVFSQPEAPITARSEADAAKAAAADGLVGQH